MYADVVFSLPLDKAFTYEVPEDLACEIGCRVIAPVGSRNRTGYIIAVSGEPPKGTFSLKQIVRSLDVHPLFGSSEIALARWMSRFYACSLGEALAAMLPSGRRDQDALISDEGDLSEPDNIILSVSQKEALGVISGRKASMYYLFGVTGSGKTEVFFRCAEETIAAGGSVIYLVPEISLSHQIADAAAKRFSGATAVIHSALTPSQRLREWKRIASGEVDLVIGARSAVFAPVPKLGMIIMDEEHEQSYKSGSHPRYHARQIALKRVMDSGSVLVMGSATPSLEAWHLMNQGRMMRLNLPERVSGGTMPEMEVVDLTVHEGPLSDRLFQEMEHTLARGKQVILFLNRRGFSYFFHCRSCGYEMQCSSCSVSLTYHRSKGTMQCHYCGYRQKPPASCPTCGSLDVGYSGFGTEMVESEVKRCFPSARVARLDTDTARKRSHLKETLDDVRTGKVDILLGTQMVAKGLNFPNVELVGIVLADSTLRIPDFRSLERTFSLITQVSGRAGRFSSAGKVIIQTYRPDNPAISCAVARDLEGFYSQELEIRRELKFPPFSRMGRLVVRGKDQARASSGVETARQLIVQCIARNASLAAVELLGPSSCPVERIAGNWRYQIILRSQEIKPLVLLLSYVKQRISLHSGLYLEVDVDPLSLM